MCRHMAADKKSSPGLLRFTLASGCVNSRQRHGFRCLALGLPPPPKRGKPRTNSEPCPIEYRGGPARSGKVCKPLILLSESGLDLARLHFPSAQPCPARSSGKVSGKVFGSIPHDFKRIPARFGAIRASYGRIRARSGKVKKCNVFDAKTCLQEGA